jgi:Zn-dependent protease with chaperone function
MHDVLNYYRKSKETTYNAILCFIGGLIWLGFLVFIFTASKSTIMGLLPLTFYAVIFILFFVISALLFRANAMGNMILVSEEQFPHINQMVIDGAKQLGINPPETFIYNSNGLLNAFARQVFGRDYLLLTSSIVDVTTDAQIKFIVGHELGHHAAGHLNFGGYLLRLPARIIPFLYKAYSRQCEYTCDRLGFYVAKDVENSCKAISMLGCGCQKLNSSLNLFAFEKQENLVPPTSGYFAEILRSHPRLTKRVISLRNTKLLD